MPLSCRNRIYFDGVAVFRKSSHDGIVRRNERILNINGLSSLDSYFICLNDQREILSLWNHDLPVREFDNDAVVLHIFTDILDKTDSRCSSVTDNNPISSVRREQEFAVFYFNLRNSNLCRCRNLLPIDQKPFAVQSPIILTIRVLTDTDNRRFTVLAIQSVSSIFTIQTLFTIVNGNGAGFFECNRIAVPGRQFLDRDNLVLVIQSINRSNQGCQVAVDFFHEQSKFGDLRFEIVNSALYFSIVVLLTSCKE